MLAPEDTNRWFDAFFADPWNGALTLLAALTLVYLFATAKNLADPAKRGSGHIKGLIIAVGLLFFLIFVVIVRDRCPNQCDYETMNLEELRSCRECKGLPP